MSEHDVARFRVNYLGVPDELIMDSREDGKWMFYEDHEQIVAELTERIDQLETALYGRSIRKITPQDIADALGPESFKLFGNSVRPRDENG